MAQAIPLPTVPASDRTRADGDVERNPVLRRVLFEPCLTFGEGDGGKLLVEFHCGVHDFAHFCSAATCEMYFSRSASVNFCNVSPVTWL